MSHPGEASGGAGPGPAPARPADPMAAPARPPAARAFFRLLFGREPEEPAEMRALLAKRPTLRRLRQDLLRDPRFHKEVRPWLRWVPLAPEPLPIETEASPADLAAMMGHIGAFWERIGQERPHHSVLTQDRFLPEKIGGNKDAFHQTGRHEAEMVATMLRRHGIGPASLRHAVDYGCGVGRTTLALAAMFDRVTGCDISASHMAIAEAEAAARGLENLAWHRATPAAPMPPGAWDLWHSRIVLQHNPPPVMVHLLRLAFAGLAPGGVAIFQLPTHGEGYGFSVAAHLARGDESRMQMHVLPQARVFALAAEAGLDLLEVREDRATGRPDEWLSNLFVMRRPR
ncbi:methyltransferase domain-containing protein [Falsiroseomonas sp. HW251]|uniref:class I SAM-dependent methyltransferase n=1 Tax=Falsiroseomonas sp. HW251 TaxID=3390998 RepID=UPI003D30F921